MRASERVRITRLHKTSLTSLNFCFISPQYLQYRLINLLTFQLFHFNCLRFFQTGHQKFLQPPSPSNVLIQDVSVFSKILYKFLHIEFFLFFSLQILPIFFLHFVYSNPLTNVIYSPDIKTNTNKLLE